MAASRRRASRFPRETRGPSGFTVFLAFLVLGVVCVAGGFGLGRYLLATLGGTVIENGVQPNAGDGAAGDTDDTGNGSNGDSGETNDGAAGPGTDGSDAGQPGAGDGSVPAGGGAGSATTGSNPLTVYIVQVGAFSSRANAETVVAELEDKGLPGYVVEPTAGTNLYKVWTVTGTRREVVDAVLAKVRESGYPDSFVNTVSLAVEPLTFQGSSVEYVECVADAVEVLVRCLRIEGDLWDDYYAGALDRSTAAADVDALISTVRQAKNALARLQAPTDLEALGEAVQQQLISALTNLQVLKSYLADQAEGDLLAAQSSYTGLIDGYARFEAALASSGS